MHASMTAMLLDGPGRPLRQASLPIPAPQGPEILIRVAACGVCRTDLQIVDGELAPHLLPLVPGHEIVGEFAIVVRSDLKGCGLGSVLMEALIGYCRERGLHDIVTMGMPAPVYRWFYGAHSLKSLQRNILGFAGVKPVRSTLVGGAGAMTPARVDTWRRRLRALGTAAR
jgi:GNAT superfamily N-acetyltransferase